MCFYKVSGVFVFSVISGPPDPNPQTQTNRWCIECVSVNRSFLDCENSLFWNQFVATSVKSTLPAFLFASRSLNKIQPRTLTDIEVLFNLYFRWEIEGRKIRTNTCALFGLVLSNSNHNCPVVKPHMCASNSAAYIE